MTDHPPHSITRTDWMDATVIWEYHQMRHDVRPCSAAIVLGSHDLGVATFAAKQYHAGYFPVLVFSGGNSPSTAPVFPRGEAVHFWEQARNLDVPDDTILLEPRAANTGQNITLSRDVLQQAGIEVSSVMLISMPYMERRAFATCRKLWPDVEIVCASDPLSFADYVTGIGDARLVIETMVGDLQRVIEYPQLGFAIEQEVPDHVNAAFQRLVRAGYTGRLLHS